MLSAICIRKGGGEGIGLCGGRRIFKGGGEGEGDVEEYILKKLEELCSASI
jgi:hypothetical protein